MIVVGVAAIAWALAVVYWHEDSVGFDSVGFPKIALFRPGTGIDPSTLAKYDWVVEDGTARGVWLLDEAKRLNPNLLGLIQPYGGVSQQDVFAATYGFGKVSSPISSPWGTLRAFSTDDLVKNVDGTPHIASGVDILNWQQSGTSDSTAIWSARVRAKYYLDNATGHPGVMGIWGDSDLWSDQGYAFNGARFSASSWDDGFVRHHQELMRLLPGAVIGGNDLSSMAGHPSRYAGTIPDAWKHVGQAGMKESTNKYFGLTGADGLDNLITGIRQFMALKLEDGQQRYEMLNVSDTTNTATMRLGLAAACISGAYFWGYPGSGGDFSSSLSLWLPEFDRHGRNWLGLPTGDPLRVAPGLWTRSFEHGTVIANASGSSRTTAGVTVPDGDGAFIEGASSPAPAPAPAPQPAPAPAPAPQPSPAPPSGPGVALMTSFTPVTDAGCSGCAVHWSGNELAATIAGGPDNLDTAYSLIDFGGPAGWAGRVWTRDVVRLASGQSVTENLAVFQVRDANDALVYELYVSSADRTIRLWSPAGGLRSGRSTSAPASLPSDGSPQSAAPECSPVRGSGYSYGPPGRRRLETARSVLE